MGATATGSVSVNTARRTGKRYSWGAERPGVIEKRVQLRKSQIDIEIVKIREEGEREIARRVAAKEAEKRKLADQERLVAEHREDLKRKRTFRPMHSYIVPKGTFSDEEIEAIMSEIPGIDREEAELLLSKRRMKAANAPEPGPQAHGPTGGVPLSSSAKAQAAGTVHRSDSPVVAPMKADAVPSKTVSSEKQKPSPAHIEAEVTHSSDSGNAAQGGLDWSGFDPDAWQKDEEFPRHLYREVADADRNYFLVPRTDLYEPEAKPVSPQIQALRDRRRELEADEEKLIQAHGRNRMLWSAEVIAEAGRLDQALTAVHKEIMQAQE